VTLGLLVLAVFLKWAQQHRRQRLVYLQIERRPLTEGLGPSGQASAVQGASSRSLIKHSGGVASGRACPRRSRAPPASGHRGRSLNERSRPGGRVQPWREPLAPLCLYRGRAMETTVKGLPSPTRGSRRIRLRPAGRRVSINETARERRAGHEAPGFRRARCHPI